MAKLRVGFGSDFNITGQKVGIGTTNPTALLEVAGIAKADFNITGVTTLTAYGGFVAQNQYINKTSTIGFATVGVGTLTQYYETETGFTDLGGVHHGDDQRFNTLSEDLVIDDGQILNITNTEMVGRTTIGEYDPHNHSSYVCAGSLEQVSVTGHFSVPNGGSNDRQSFIEGTVRFNTDLNTLEFFNGNEWRQFTYNQGQSGRSLFAGGRGDPGGGNTDYTEVYSMQVNTLGSVIDFGDLTLGARYGGCGCSNSTRGIVGGGWASPANDFDIEYFTLASGGNGIDWGQNNTGGWGSQGASSSIRGLNAGGGYPSGLATIESIFFSTIGSKEDFGDINAIRYRGDRSCNSTVRGVFSGGYTPASVNTMDAKNLHSTADTVEFGELNRVQIGLGAASDSTRGVWMGGWAGNIPAGSSDVAIDMITIATFGNAVEFGELSDKRHGTGSCQNMIRGVVVGGNTSGSSLRGEYITIQSAGNAIDFGDLNTSSTTIFSQPVAMPDSHGGLGGF